MPKKKFYCVRKGRSVGIFNDWATCQAATSGFSGAEFKSFSTLEEAQAYMRGAAGGGAAAAGGQGGGTAATQRQQQQQEHPGGGSSHLTGSKRAYADTIDRAPPPAFTTNPPAAAAAAAASGAGVAAPSNQHQQQQQLGRMVTIFFDGGSRGNPGRAGYGYVVYDRPTMERLRMGCRPLPFGSTNNEAEYSGMIAGLRYALDLLNARHVVIKGDSQLAVKQMTGEYRVNAPTILPLFREAKLLQDRFESFEIQHVYREDNTMADQLSNVAMDTDAVVDQIAAGRAGSSRRQIALALVHACQLEEAPGVMEELCTTANFLETAAKTLSKIWDDMAVEEVMAQLAARGWTEATGGQPEASRSGGVGAGGGGGSGRGQQTVAVAAVTLGPQWASEIQRQEQLMTNQHQQQQQPVKRQEGGGGGGRGGRGGGGSSGGSALGFGERHWAAGNGSGRSGTRSTTTSSSSSSRLTQQQQPSRSAVPSTWDLHAAQDSMPTLSKRPGRGVQALSNSTAAAVLHVGCVQQLAAVAVAPHRQQEQVVRQLRALSSWHSNSRPARGRVVLPAPALLPPPQQVSLLQPARQQPRCSCSCCVSSSGVSCGLLGSACRRCRGVRGAALAAAAAAVAAAAGPGTQRLRHRRMTGGGGSGRESGCGAGGAAMGAGRRPYL